MSTYNSLYGQKGVWFPLFKPPPWLKFHRLQYLEILEIDNLLQSLNKHTLLFMLGVCIKRNKHREWLINNPYYLGMVRNSPDVQEQAFKYENKYHIVEYYYDAHLTPVIYFNNLKCH